MLTSVRAESTARSRDGVVQEDGNTDNTTDSLFLLLDLLLDSVILEFDREDRAVAFGDGIETASCFVEVENDQFGDYEIAERTNVVFILKAGDDAVVEIEDVNTGEGSFHERVQSLVSALEDISTVHESRHEKKRRTFRTSRPSSTLCLNGPIITSRISSGLISDSLMTSGIRTPRFGMMRSGLL